MSVPFLDVGFTYRTLKAETDAAIARVMDSGWFIMGQELTAFEQAYAAWCGAAHCVGAANGLDAIYLALKALEIGPGDEVIVPAHTFIATWLAVSRAGATIVPVEVDPATFQLTADAIVPALTARTKAVIPVHLYGHPADMDAIMTVARAHGLKVVEDAAQAHGAAVRGRRIGAHGDAVAWSFYPGKNLGAFGDGGAVTCNDAGLAARIRQLGNYGSAQKYVHDEEGCNSRLDEMQAACLAVKLKALDGWNAHRTTLAAVYTTALAESAAILPGVADWALPVWHLYVIRVADRDGVLGRLRERGVQASIHYPIACHRQGAYSAQFGTATLPLAEEIAATCLSLPIGPHVSADQAVEVAAVVRSVLEA